MGSASDKPTAAEESGYPSRRAMRYQQKQAQTRRRIIAAVIGGLLVIAVVVVVVVSASGDDGPATTTPFAGSTLDITLGDYVIQGDLTAPTGLVRLHATNQGGIVHNIGVRNGPITANIQPGQSADLDLGTLIPGTYQLYCDIVGHVEKGMVANLVVTAPGAGTTVAPPTS